MSDRAAAAFAKHQAEVEDRPDWPALSDPIHDAQRHFRLLLAAMAEPGTRHNVTAPTPPNADNDIGAALWGTLLTLCDLDTTVWIDPRLDTPALRRTLIFLTGTHVHADPTCADFAVVLPDTPITRLPFSRGSRAWPDRSTTLLVAVPLLDTVSADTPDQGWWLSGPGIATPRAVSIGTATGTLFASLATTRADFPLGLDAILTCADQLMALPRSTRLERAAPELPTAAACGEENK